MSFMLREWFRQKLLNVRHTKTASTGLFLFAIPLIAKYKCENWERVLFLLNDTLRSVLNQTDPNFRVLIAANDEIGERVAIDKRISLIVLPEANLNNKNPDLNREQRDGDAGYKKWMMTNIGEDMGAKYIMYLDADDVLRSDLVQKVREAKPEIAAIIRAGYLENMATGKMLQLPRIFSFEHTRTYYFDMLCGSSIIFTYPENPKTNWVLDLVGGGHHLVWRRLNRFKMKALEFNEPMVIYRQNTGVNMTHHHSNKPKLSRWMNYLFENIDTEGFVLSKTELRKFGLNN